MKIVLATIASGFFAIGLVASASACEYGKAKQSVKADTPSTVATLQGPQSTPAPKGKN